jgi:hypothetical protein
MSLGGGNIAQGRSNIVYIVDKGTIYAYFIGEELHSLHVTKEELCSTLCTICTICWVISLVTSHTSRVRVQSCALFLSGSGTSMVRVQPSTLFCFWILNSHTHSDTVGRLLLYYNIFLQYNLYYLTLGANKGRQRRSTHGNKGHTWRARTGSAHVPCGSSMLSVHT